MRTLKISGAAALAFFALFVGTLFVAAQGLSGSDPANAPYLDNQPHTLAANSGLLYRFDYSVNHMTGERPVTTLVLKNGNNSGVGFEMWTADAVNDMANNKPIGRGTLFSVDCVTGEPAAQGQCQSPDLTWSGGFGTDGTYYVRVVNYNSTAMSFLLVIQGSGFGLGPQASGVGTPTATVSPAASISTPVPAANADDPNRAGTIDNLPHTLPANSAVWYSFDYAINNMTGARPVYTITLIDGNNSGVGFEVYAPENINGWWQNHPTGRGTVYSIDCETGEPSEGGQCQSLDLTWMGHFGMSGKYYVRVVNSNSHASDYLLTIQQIR